MQQKNKTPGLGGTLVPRLATSLCSLDWRLWIAIMATMLLPSIYQTVRIFFLGSLPDTWSFSIASQNQYVSLFYEVIQEALILPLYFVLGKSLDNKVQFATKVRTGLMVTAAVYALLSAILVVTAHPLVVFMGQDSQLVEATVTYIRLETLASLFATLWRFMMAVLVLLGRDRIMYAVLAVQMILSILLDTFLVSTLPCSLQMGVNGIALTNIAVNLLMVAISLFLLNKERVLFSSSSRLDFRKDFRWIGQWIGVGKFSGLESLVRNIAFMLMVVRLVNLVAEQGNYWVANNFIWNWLLLPSLALADLVKKEVGESLENIEKKTAGYLTLTTILSLLWLASIPLWKFFLQRVMNIEDYQLVFMIVLIQTPFYIVFLFNNLLDSTLCGAGRLDYLLVQTLLINGIYYGGLFILYLLGIFRPGLTGICLMFGFGMALDLIPTIIQYRRFLHHHGLKIKL